MNELSNIIGFVAVICLIVFIPFTIGRKILWYTSLWVLLFCFIEISQWLLIRTTFFPFVESLICLVCSPDDYFTPLDEKKIVQNQHIYRLSSRHKYRGCYGVELVVPQYIDHIGRIIKIPFSISVRLMRDGNKKTILKESDYIVNYAWTPSEFKCYYMIYSIPKDCKRNETYNIEVSFEGSDFERFIKKNPGCKIRVVKISDE